MRTSDPIQLFMDANRKLGELEDMICIRLKKVLAEFGKNRVVDCRFEREYYQMKIEVDTREYTISVQGRGVDMDRYDADLLKIIETEVKF